MARKKRSSKLRKVVVVIILIGLAGGAWKAWDLYNKVYYPNVRIETQQSTFLYIPTGSNHTDVANLLYEGGYIKNQSSFEWMAEKKNYANHVHPGKYRLSDGMNNNELINLLRSGEQEAVNVVIHNIRTLGELAGAVAGYIEEDSVSLQAMLTDADLAAKYGFNTTTFRSMFLPNTYQFYWNTSGEQFIQRMAEEYKKFWNEDRVAKARSLGMSQSEVTTLASIVYCETKRAGDMPRVAGVYINRLRIGMALQADPTLIWAANDFTIKRVLKKHKKIDSPYNTYMYPGLPPGPIFLAPTAYIDAVLNYEDHDFLYFCAKPDFSGYSNFSKTYKQHQRYARQWQKALNERNIH